MRASSGEKVRSSARASERASLQETAARVRGSLSATLDSKKDEKSYTQKSIVARDRATCTIRRKDLNYICESCVAVFERSCCCCCRLSADWRAAKLATNQFDRQQSRLGIKRDARKRTKEQTAVRQRPAGSGLKNAKER